MMPETAEWFDEDGNLMTKKLISMGIEPKAWWY
jgi:hypothetical protein